MKNVATTFFTKTAAPIRFERGSLVHSIYNLLVMLNPLSSTNLSMTSLVRLKSLNLLFRCLPGDLLKLVFEHLLKIANSQRSTSCCNSRGTGEILSHTSPTGNKQSSTLFNLINLWLWQTISNDEDGKRKLIDCCARLQECRSEIVILFKEIDEVVSRDSTLTTLSGLVENVIRDCETKVVVSHTQSYKMEMSTLVRDIISRSSFCRQQQQQPQTTRKRQRKEEEVIVVPTKKITRDPRVQQQQQQKKKIRSAKGKDCEALRRACQHHLRHRHQPTTNILITVIFSSSIISFFPCKYTTYLDPIKLSSLSLLHHYRACFLIVSRSNALDSFWSDCIRDVEKSHRQTLEEVRDDDYNRQQYVNSKFMQSGFGKPSNTNDNRIIRRSGVGGQKSLQTIESYGGRNMVEAYTNKYVQDYETSAQRANDLSFEYLERYRLGKEERDELDKERLKRRREDLNKLFGKPPDDDDDNKKGGSTIQKRFRQIAKTI